jgi:hypothetical protein
MNLKFLPESKEANDSTTQGKNQGGEGVWGRLLLHTTSDFFPFSQISTIRKKMFLSVLDLNA